MLEDERIEPKRSAMNAVISKISIIISIDSLGNWMMESGQSGMMQGVEVDANRV